MGRISMSLSHPLSCWFQWSVFCYILFRSVINNVQCDVNTSEESHWSHSQPSSEAWIKLDCWSLLPSFGRWRQNPPCCVTTSKSWRLVERIITKTLITALLLLYLTCMEHVQKLNTLISDIKIKITVRCSTMFINIDWVTGLFISYSSKIRMNVTGSNLNAIHFPKVALQFPEKLNLFEVVSDE